MIHVYYVTLRKKIFKKKKENVEGERTFPWKVNRKIYKKRKNKTSKGTEKEKGKERMKKKKKKKKKRRQENFKAFCD